MTHSSSHLTREQILHIAKLANIKLTEQEVEKFQKQLSSVIGYIDKLKEINTDTVDAISQVTGLTNVTAEDGMVNKRKLTQEQALKNARSKKNGFIRVDAIFREK